MSAPAARPVEPLATPATSAPRLVNAANALTALRLALVPVFAVCLLTDGGQRISWRIGATVVFGVASLTDRIDGQVARSHDLVTNLGKVADPLADKALIGMAFVGLTVLGLLPAWVTALVLARELAVTALRFWVIRHGVIAASRGGKWKTFLQAIAIGLYVLPLPPALWLLRAVVMGVAVAVTVGTGADYLARALRLRRTSPRAVAKRAGRTTTR